MAAHRSPFKIAPVSEINTADLVTLVAHLAPHLQKSSSRHLAVAHLIRVATTSPRAPDRKLVRGAHRLDLLNGEIHRIYSPERGLGDRVRAGEERDFFSPFH